MNSGPLRQYQDLLVKVDAKFAELQARSPENFSCRLGCHSCCKPGLTVNAVEAENIRDYLGGDLNAREAVLANEAAAPHLGARCSFLTKDGACLIYPVRPIVCRSHGAPLQFKENSVVYRDVCPLNYQGKDVAALPGEDVLNLDTVNLVLAAIVRVHGSDIRTPLTPSALTK